MYLIYLNQSSIVELKWILIRLAQLCGITEDAMSSFAESKINKSADDLLNKCEGANSL